MPLTLDPVLRQEGIDPSEILVIRHVFDGASQGGGSFGLSPDATDQQILEYTSEQSAKPRNFPVEPPQWWAVFLRDGGSRARLWAVLENRGEIYNDGIHRRFNLEVTTYLDDLRNRLVIEWNSPRTWKLNGTTAARYRVVELADRQPEPFPGFDRIVLDWSQLQAVMRDQKYVAWRTALASVVGIYLITDTRDGRQYVGKADGAERVCQRWRTYASNGHGGNVELRNIDPTTFRYSLLRVFDPSSPQHLVDEAETHFKWALDSRAHGLNRN